MHPSLWRTYVLTETGVSSPVGASVNEWPMSSESSPGGLHSLRSIARSLRSRATLDVQMHAQARALQSSVRASAISAVKTMGNRRHARRRGPMKRGGSPLGVALKKSGLGTGCGDARGEQNLG